MLRWLKRLTTIVIIVALLTSNALTLTSSSFNAVVSGAVAGAMGIKTLSQLNRETLERQRAAVTRMGTRMKQRVVKIASRSTVRSAVTWLPIAGVTVAVALTAWELTELCRGMQDLDRLYHEMEIDEEVTIEVCQAPDQP